MGRITAATAARPAKTQEELVASFARLMRDRYGARIYLFGSRARGNATANSDFDLVAVAEAFRGQRVTTRLDNRLDLWHEAGGWGAGLDLHCYTPEEFREELRGVGYLPQAKRRGELIRIRAAKAA